MLLNSYPAPAGGGGGNPVFVTDAKGESGSVGTAVAALTPTAGNALIVRISTFGGTQANHSVTDNLSGTYTKVIGQDNTGSTAQVSIWYRMGIPAGVLTVTAGDSGAAAVTFFVGEVSGISTFTALEDSSFANVTAPTSSPQSPNTGTLTNGTAKSIFFTILTNSIGSGTVTMTINAAGTVGVWVLNDGVTVNNSQETNANLFLTASSPHIVVAASTAEVHVWAASGMEETTAIACFH